MADSDRITDQIGVSQDELLRRHAGLAERAVASVLPPDDYSIVMINHSENTTYLVTNRNGDRFILRINRSGYHTRNAINSELLWTKVLREQAAVRTPEVLAAADGQIIHHINSPAAPEGRNCVFFEFLTGDEPDEDSLLPNFPALGEVTARMHRFTRSWSLPEGFERFHWNCETILGAQPHWGHWYDGLNLNEERRAVLSRAAKVMTDHLNRFSQGREVYGLVHADMRLANLLVEADETADETKVIDFDDCGFSWYLWDLATALSFIEDRTDVPDLIAAWLEGYRKVQPLSTQEEAEIPTFVMLRRLQLVAWIGSHHETDLAQEMGADFTVVSCDLAETYLSQYS